MRQNPLAYLDDELNELRRQGLYRRLRVLDGEQAAHTSVDHRQVVNLSSNNYLGSDDAPDAAGTRARGACRRFGVGTGSVRTIAGTMAIHMELERRLAAFKQTEAAVVFQSGFTANAGTVSSILGRDDVIVSDELNHASIIDGARLSRATIKVFPHRDVDAARQIVAALPRAPADAAHHRRRLQHGRRPRRASGALRPGRRVRLHHDGGRRARERRVRRARPRHRRSLRHARPRGRAGRHALEGDRRARRLRRRIDVAHRVPPSPRAAVPVLDVASAVGRGHLHRRARRARERAAVDGAALGQHPLLQGRPRRRSASTPASARARSRR